VTVGVPDLNGTLRVKQLPAGGLSAPDGVTFSDIVFVLDIADALIPRPDGYDGWWPEWSGGFGDLLARPDPTTDRPIAWWPNHRHLFADLYHRDGTAVAVAPRQVLARLVAACAQRGLTVTVGTEVEFFLTQPGQPVSPTAGRAYAPAAQEPILSEVAALLAISGIGVHSWYVEGGVGQHELALSPADPVLAADHVLLCRQAIRQVAGGHGRQTWFMAKPGPGYGNGLHLHVSIHAAGENLLCSPPGADRPTDVGARCLAGIVDTLPAATALVTPTVNGYKRLAPHTTAGTTATWGLDNRSAGVRYLDRGDDSRIEVRTAAGDANPYLAIAAALAGILHGMEQSPPLPPPVPGDAYTAGEPLPGDLLTATTLLEASRPLRLHLGQALVLHYAATRRWEAAAFAATVTDWELHRYGQSC
jgi:glutamine synthetase